MFKKLLIKISLIAILSLLFIGCSQLSKHKQSNVNKEPITLMDASPTPLPKKVNRRRAPNRDRFADVPA